MSAFTHPGASGFPLLAASDGRLLVDEYADDPGVLPPAIVGLLYTASDFLGIDDWSTEYWPGGGSWSLSDGGLSEVVREVAYQRYYPQAGANGRFSWAGYTRDKYGSAVGSCTVRAFRASTGEMVASVTSDIYGAYTLTTPYYEAHLLTINNNTVTPPIAGASVDTLFPS